MNHVNKYLRNFKPYKLASHKVWTVSQKERDKILKLDWNESTIEPSPKVKKALLNLINNNKIFNLYPSTYNAHLYELLSQYSGLPIDNIQYFGSSDSLHEYIAKLFISVGDPVVIVWPSYDNFRLTVEVSGGRIYYFNVEDDFTTDFDKLDKFIDSVDASLVYLCNPNNPTGKLSSPKDIEKLVLKHPETIFLIDEAYYEFAGDNSSCASLVINNDNIVVSRTMSKAFGIANFRFGYLLASEKNIKYISTIRNPKNITTFAQVAASAVLSDVDYMKNYVSEVKEAREYFYNEISKINGLEPFKTQSNYMMIRFKDYESKMALFNYLSDNNIFVRNIDQSEMVHCCLRISIGTKKQMERVVSTIKKFYGQN